MWTADKRPLGSKLELGLDIQNHSKCPRPSSDQVRALEPRIRDNTGCPKIVGRKDVTFPKSRFGPYSGFQGPNLVRTWSRTLRTHPRVATTRNTGQYGTSESRWAKRCNFSDTIFGFLTKSQKPPKVEDCKMELGLVPGWDWASPKIRWAKRCNFPDQIFV